MSKFTTPLNIDLLDQNKWKLQKSFEYHVGCYPSKEIIVVPAGFITDFASVPRIFWNIFPPAGRYGKAAIIHDWCYQTAFQNRRRSDEIFLEGMKVLKVKKWKYKIIYYSVRLFGGIVWKSYRRKTNASMC